MPLEFEVVCICLNLKGEEKFGVTRMKNVWFTSNERLADGT